MARIVDWLLTAPQYLLPQHLISRAIYALTRIRGGGATTLAIRIFARVYNVELALAERPEPRAYDTFNAFFTRALRDDARPVDPDPATVVSPVDGCVSAAGDIGDDSVFQAKGRCFSLAALTGDANAAGTFSGGNWTTLYLSPRDYHRIHMPCDGQLVRMRYIPGRLFSVNARTTRTVDNLFARNERLVLEFAAEFGTFTLVMVGAMCVGSMSTGWAGAVGPDEMPPDGVRDYRDAPIAFSRGDELARFNMGSTVILLYPPGVVTWAETLTENRAVVMGTAIGKRQPGS
ncbi:MAG: phosphatidylserine decarboxylase [Gammaproteobacteria bacterium]|nr:phosphatidylserine decarboxylase [Gammaproteobacteria bacterium]NNM01097.1 phosphatidylserine decarboxylase [Gammaproteobacteria bacterium]